MRISDWSSDVCSSDLLRVWPQDLCRRRNCGACCGNTCNNRYLGKNAEKLVSGCTRAYRSGDMKFDGINSRCAQRRAGCDDKEFPGFQIQIGSAVKRKRVLQGKGVSALLDQCVPVIFKKKKIY